MPGTVIGKVMLQGYPGSFARNSDCIIAARMVRNVAGDSGPSFGDPCVLVGSGTASINNTFQSVADYIAAARTNETFAMAVFAGVAVREVKTYETYSANMPSTGVYLPATLADVIERGSVVVVCNYGTPIAGGPVFVRTDTGAYAGVIGGFETGTSGDTDGATRVEITNAFWTTGLKDANNVCELTLVTRNLP